MSIANANRRLKRGKLAHEKGRPRQVSPWLHRFGSSYHALQPIEKL
jgi:hypothetical protein